MVKINRKSYYTVDFDDDEIISKSIEEIKSLTVATLKAYITEGNMISNDTSTKFNIEKKLLLIFKILLIVLNMT